MITEKQKAFKKWRDFYKRQLEELFNDRGGFFIRDDKEVYHRGVFIGSLDEFIQKKIKNGKEQKYQENS